MDQLELRRLRRTFDATDENSLAREGETCRAIDDDHACMRAGWANHAQDNVFASLSHELQTPLDAVIGFSEALFDGTFGPLANPKHEEFIRVIHESGQHMLSLVSRLLDHASFRQSNMPVSEEWVDLASVLKQCLQMFAEQARSNGIILESRIPPELPKLWADRQHLMQMLANLIGNSVKFTGPNVFIHVSADLAADGCAAIRVADTGASIDVDGFRAYSGRLCSWRPGS